MLVNCEYEINESSKLSNSSMKNFMLRLYILLLHEESSFLRLYHDSQNHVIIIINLNPLYSTDVAMKMLVCLISFWPIKN